MQLNEIFVQIDQGNIGLPYFQRSYVWQRQHVRPLMKSLYLKHPVGTLLTWQTEPKYALMRGKARESDGTVRLMLDGQQRITTLYGIANGKPPPWFAKSAEQYAFSRLYFNIEEEDFKFYAFTMKGDPLWIDVTAFMQMGAGKYLGRLVQELPDVQAGDETFTLYLDRLNRLEDILKKEFSIENVYKADLDTAIQIFNRVNSSGTPLSQGDLALAKLSGKWPAVRDVMEKRLKNWEDEGYAFTMDWLLRCANAIVTGRAQFIHLHEVDIDKFKQGLGETEKLIDRVLNLIADRLGLDHDRVLRSPFAIPAMISYLKKRGDVANHRERDKLLCWYLHCVVWGRYSSSTESTLGQDLLAIATDNPMEALFDNLRITRGDLRVGARDFQGSTVNNRFYALIYLLTRVNDARDFKSDVRLKAHLLGKSSRLHLHHIFPKSKLHKHGYPFPIVNAIANFTFLTEETNINLSDDDPAVYFEEAANKYPGILESHWIPMDPELWQYERYLDFLAARRGKLAQAANDFLQQLETGNSKEQIDDDETKGP